MATDQGICGHYSLPLSPEQHKLVKEVVLEQSQGILEKQAVATDLTAPFAWFGSKNN